MRWEPGPRLVAPRQRALLAAQWPAVPGQELAPAGLWGDGRMRQHGGDVAGGRGTGKHEPRAALAMVGGGWGERNNIGACTVLNSLPSAKLVLN